MKKLIALLLSLFMLNISAEAKNLNKSFNSLIRESHISKNSIAISVKNAESGKTVFAQNDRILMHPASVQKLLTIIPVTEELGDDYTFKTELYKRSESEYLLKLGADPYLKSEDLDNIVNSINAKTVNKIYIDNTVIESKDWGEGWQWDDDLNTSMPRFNSYNLDGNITKITVMPTDPNKQAFIINPQNSPVIFFNNVITGDKNDIKISRNNNISANTIKLEGTVSTPQIFYIPNNNLKLYFNKKLTDSLENRRIYLKAPFVNSEKTDKDVMLTSVEHPLSNAVSDVLLNSNNMVIETMAKLAGGKYYGKEGSDSDGIKLFEEYCKKHNIDASRIRIVDAGGVSKNNLADADFITEYLYKNKDNKLVEKMASPGQGTLAARMLPLKNYLKAKTGTLSDISSIAGYLTTKSGHKYVFCIMINDPVSDAAAKKSLENYLIREMYFKL
jgi:D-alanyl-D-alanine carboxypeptidase/D-alanyl-D-alanine-endopeptidase (penicillin-binding protein 4)